VAWELVYPDARTNTVSSINLYAQKFRACESCCLESLLAVGIVAFQPLQSRNTYHSHYDERASIKTHNCQSLPEGGFSDEEFEQPYRNWRSSATEVNGSAMDPSWTLRNLVLSYSDKLDLPSSSTFFHFVEPNL
jgi:hypothetical protein